MHAADILAWTCDGAVFCPSCKPEPTARAAAVGHDDVHPWFADAEAALVGATCDGCRACYVSNGTLRDGDWLPFADCEPPYVYFYRCPECEAAQPSTDGGKAPACGRCGYGPCITPTADGRKRAQWTAEARKGAAWPGGYPVHAVMADGEPLCFRCVDREAHRLLAAEPERDWRIVGVAVHWEGEPLECAHCGSAMASAYGPEDCDPPDPDGEGPLVPMGGA